MLRYVLIKPTDFFVPGVSLFFVSVVLELLIPDSHVVPDVDRSLPWVFCPMPTTKVGVCWVFWPFGHFDESLMPESG